MTALIATTATGDIGVGTITYKTMVLPTVILACREALRAVPSSIRDGALALGATRWQSVRHQVLPAAVPGIVTGVILALSRAIGETAPLLLVGATVFRQRVHEEQDDQQHEDAAIWLRNRYSQRW